MGNVNFKLNYVNITTSRTAEKATANAEEVIDKAVEKAVAKAAENKQKEDEVKKPIPAETKSGVDPMQMLAEFNKAQVSESQFKKHSVTGNPVAEEPSEITTRDGGQDILDFDRLVEKWYELDFDTASYDVKDNLMVRIINAALVKANEYAQDSLEYKEWIDKANTWRCYRVIMRNNYQQELYFELRQRLLNGEPFDEVFSNIGHEDEPNWAAELLMRLQRDAGREYWAEDEEDFRSSFYVHDDANGGRGHYNNDFSEGFQYFGGIADWDENKNDFVYTPNQDPEQRFMYNEAMIAMYTTKILAAQIRLKDPDIINNQNQTFKEALEKNIREYRRLIQGFIVERNTLANDPNIEWHNQDDLIPGLRPPKKELDTTAFDGEVLQYRDYFAKKESYKATPNINVLQELIEMAGNYYNEQLSWETNDEENPRHTHHEFDSLYWLTEINFLNQLLNQGASNNGRGSTTSAAAGGRGASEPVTSRQDSNPFQKEEKFESVTFVNNTLRTLQTGAEKFEEPDVNEEKFIAEQKEYELRYKNYKEKQKEERQKDLLKSLLDDVRKMLKTDDNEKHHTFWLREYKKLSAEWEEFVANRKFQ